MSHRSMWLGGLVTALAFLIVAPAAFGYTKPDINVIKDGSVANIQQQIASQKADLSQGGTSVSGDATSNGGTAVGGNGGGGGMSVSKIDNSSNASANTGACQKAGCSTDSTGGSGPSTSNNSVDSSGDQGNTGGEGGLSVSIVQVRHRQRWRRQERGQRERAGQHWPERHRLREGRQHRR